MVIGYKYICVCVCGGSREGERGETERGKEGGREKARRGREQIEGQTNREKERGGERQTDR